MTANSTKPANPTCWVVHDGAAGNRRQAVALAQAMGLGYDEWTLSPRLPARWLAPRKLGSPESAFGASFAHQLRVNAPRVVIGCGRIASLATRYARDAGATTVQILDPRLPSRHWDWVIAPEHDGLTGENVLTLRGSLHPVDALWLQQARGATPSMQAFATPRLALLLGGPTAAVTLTTDDLDLWCTQIDRWLSESRGSLLICGSRRTPVAWIERLRKRYGDGSHLLWLQPTDGDNPYPSVLAWADRIVVSADSVNMLSEACATTAPVLIAGCEKASGRVGRFVASLLATGRAQSMDQPTAYQPPIEPLIETARIAASLRARLRLD